MLPALLARCFEEPRLSYTGRPRMKGARSMPVENRTFDLLHCDASDIDTHGAGS